MVHCVCCHGNTYSCVSRSLFCFLSSFFLSFCLFLGFIQHAAGLCVSFADCYSCVCLLVCLGFLLLLFCFVCLLVCLFVCLFFVCCFVWLVGGCFVLGCLTPQDDAHSISLTGWREVAGQVLACQWREVEDQTCYHTQSQFSDSEPTKLTTENIEMESERGMGE